MKGQSLGHRSTGPAGVREEDKTVVLCQGWHPDPEKLRYKLGGLDADLVDDVVALGRSPCKMEFRTECDE